MPIGDETIKKGTEILGRFFVYLGPHFGAKSYSFLISFLICSICVEKQHRLLFFVRLLPFVFRSKSFARLLLFVSERFEFV